MFELKKKKTDKKKISFPRPGIIIVLQRNDKHKLFIIIGTLVIIRYQCTR